MHKDLFPVVTACEATGLARRIQGKRREWRKKKANKEWILKRECGVKLLHLFLMTTATVTKTKERDYTGQYDGIYVRPWFGPG